LRRRLLVHFAGNQQNKNPKFFTWDFGLVGNQQVVQEDNVSAIKKGTGRCRWSLPEGRFSLQHSILGTSQEPLRVLHPEGDVRFQ
jgi:hypothetical protein